MGVVSKRDLDGHEGGGDVCFRPEGDRPRSAIGSGPPLVGRGTERGRCPRRAPGERDAAAVLSPRAWGRGGLSDKWPHRASAPQPPCCCNARWSTPKEREPRRPTGRGGRADGTERAPLERGAREDARGCRESPGRPPRRRTGPHSSTPRARLRARSLALSRAACERERTGGETKQASADGGTASEPNALEASWMRGLFPIFCAAASRSILALQRMLCSIALAVSTSVRARVLVLRVPLRSPVDRALE